MDCTRVYKTRQCQKQELISVWTSGRDLQTISVSGTLKECKNRYKIAKPKKCVKWLIGTISGKNKTQFVQFVNILPG